MKGKGLGGGRGRRQGREGGGREKRRVRYTDFALQTSDTKPEIFDFFLLLIQALVDCSHKSLNCKQIKEKKAKEDNRLEIEGKRKGRVSYMHRSLLFQF